MVDFTELKLTEEEPIYLQIIRFVKLLIVSGKALNEEEMPSRRYLSVLLSVNPNTIQKAYHQMEEEGLLISYAGAKSILSIKPGKREQIKKELLIAQTRLYVTTVSAMGLSLSETINVIKENWGEQT